LFRGKSDTGKQNIEDAKQNISSRDTLKTYKFIFILKDLGIEALNFPLENSMLQKMN